MEPTVVDNEVMVVEALAENDNRRFDVRVAGPTALLVAKLHKLGERRRDAPQRIDSKDAYDAYRLLLATDTQIFVEVFSRLFDDEVAGESAHKAEAFLRELFASPEAEGAQLVGEAEAQGLGDPAVASAAVSALAVDVLDGI